MTALLKLYPGAWRSRYGDEMEALLEDRRPNLVERVDLVRGAIDAWLHPPTPSLAPVLAALIGGGLWTIVAAGVMVQPVPPDWPGYLAETVPLALAAAICLLVAAGGCLLRAGEARSRITTITIAFVLLGYFAWIAMLSATIVGAIGGPALAAAQAWAMVGTTAIGLILIRAGDEPIGILLVVAPVALLLPWSSTWLLFGAAWTAIGIAMWLDRQARAGPGAIAT